MLENIHTIYNTYNITSVGHLTFIQSCFSIEDLYYCLVLLLYLSFNTIRFPLNEMNKIQQFLSNNLIHFHKVSNSISSLFYFGLKNGYKI